MKPELKVKVLDALSKSEPTCFTKENVYKCGNDGMVCFNGMIAELINGKDAYDSEYFFDQAYQMAWEHADEELLEEVTNELRDNDIWDELSEEEQERLIDKYFERARDNYDPDVSSDEVNSLVADTISDDLSHIYEDYATIDFINTCHYDWINGKIDFDLAMAEVERRIVQEE